MKTKALKTSMILVGFVLVVCFGILSQAGDLRSTPQLWVPLFLVTSSWMGVACWRFRSFQWLWVFAILLRFVSVFGEPWFSDDLYRYQWDGAMHWEGIHPYAYAPDDPALDNYAPELREKINHWELHTIYPPAAQLYFAIVSGFANEPWVFKLVAAIADLGILLWLFQWTRKYALPQGVLWFYGWNPWVIAETAGTGHLEPIGVLMLCLAVSWADQKQLGRSAVSFVAAVLMKWFALVGALVMFKRWNRKAWIVAGLTVLTMWLPYAVTGPALGGGTSDYAERWEYNASVYALTEGSLHALWPTELAKQAVESLQTWIPLPNDKWDWVYHRLYPREIARIFLVAVGVWLLWFWSRRGPRALVPALRDGLLILLLLSPTVHPWYALWVLPFALVSGRPSVGIWGFWLMGTYMFKAEVPVLYRCLEYGVFALAWFWDVRRFGHRSNTGMGY